MGKLEEIIFELIDDGESEDLGALVAVYPKLIVEKNKNELTPVEYAAREKEWGCVDAIACHVETNGKDEAAYSVALVLAIHAHQTKAALSLIAAGAYINYGAFYEAIQADNQYVLSALLRKFKQNPKQFDRFSVVKAVEFAINTDNVSAFTQLLEDALGYDICYLTMALNAEKWQCAEAFIKNTPLIQREGKSLSQQMIQAKNKSVRKRSMQGLIKIIELDFKIDDQVNATYRQEHQARLSLVKQFYTLAILECKISQALDEEAIGRSTLVIKEFHSRETMPFECVESRKRERIELLKIDSTQKLFSTACIIGLLAKIDVQRAAIKSAGERVGAFFEIKVLDAAFVMLGFILNSEGQFDERATRGIFL